MPPEKLVELLPPPLRPNELLPPWQFWQEKLLPLEEDPLNDLLGPLKVLPELSEDLKLRLTVEGELKDLSLPLLGALKDLPELSDRLKFLPLIDGELKDLSLVRFGPLKDLPSLAEGP